MTLEVEPFRQLVSQLPLPDDAISPIYDRRSDVTPTPISVAFGDGVGPDIMEATLRVMDAASANLKIEEVQLVEAATSAGRDAETLGNAFNSIRATKVLLKAPSTPSSKSRVNSLRAKVFREFGLFASIQPCIAYHPFVFARQSNADLVIVKPNDEDLYAGIEHRQTDDVYQCLRIISRSGCERIIGLAFEFAVRTGRRKVSCFCNQEKMTLTDGLFSRVFDEVAARYPGIEAESCAIETDTALLLEEATKLDVVVTPNLYGDLLSLAVARSVAPIGCAHHVHLGTDYSMFEAAHDLTRTSVERNVANPSGLMLASVIMLLRIGQLRAAELIHNAWLRTIEDGVHTADMSSSHVRSRRIVGTAAFAERVIGHLGETPSFLRAARYKESPLQVLARGVTPRPTLLARKTLVGVDVFVHWRGIQSRALAETMRCAQDGNLELTMIDSRGIKVWPGPGSNVLRTDHWRCRYRARPGKPLSHADIAELQSRLAYLGIDFIKTDHLYEFDGDPGLVNEPTVYQA